MINIHGRYNEGYEDGYKNGIIDTLVKIENVIDKLDVTDECKYIIKKKLDKEFKR